MQPSSTPHLISQWIGWFLIAAAVTQFPLIIAGITAFNLAPRAGQILLLISVPTTLLLLAGGLGLILGRMFGYWCVYLATFFGGLGFGTGISYVPFIQRWLKIGPHTGDVILALNLALVGLLVWEHLHRLWELDPSEQKRHRVALWSILALGLCSVGFGRSMVDHEKGEVLSLYSLPTIGTYFTNVSTGKSPVRFVSVQTRIPKGITLVFSGHGTPDQIDQLSQIHSLKSVTNSVAHQKFLLQARVWKLNPSLFPTNFSPEDTYLIGRLKDAPKLSLQLVYSKSSSRFTGQVLGILPE